MLRVFLAQKIRDVSGGSPGIFLNLILQKTDFHDFISRFFSFSMRIDLRNVKDSKRFLGLSAAVMHCQDLHISVGIPTY
jgi:hypothetical protein